MAPRCQCDPSCTQAPMKGKPYCRQHKGCKATSPLSGSEHTFKPSKYNDMFEMQDTHNCFAYAFDYTDKPDPATCNKEGCDVPFHQPGRKVGFPKWRSVKGKRCPDLIGRLRGDVPGLELTTFTRRCPRVNIRRRLSLTRLMTTISIARIRMVHGHTSREVRR